MINWLKLSRNNVSNVMFPLQKYIVCCGCTFFVRKTNLINLLINLLNNKKIKKKYCLNPHPAFKKQTAC